MSTRLSINPREMIYLAAVRSFSNEELLHAMRPDTPWRRNNFPYVFRGFSEIVMRRAFGKPRPIGMIFAKLGDEDLGLISLQKVTNAGAQFMREAQDNMGTLSQLRYHAWGLGNTPEDVTNVDLDDELTTQIDPVNTRAQGTLSFLSSRVFRSVGLTTIIEGVNLREFGMWTTQAVGTGVLADRSVFSVRAVSANIVATSTFFLEYIPA